MSTLILFNKPFGVLSQFSGAIPEQTLAHYIPIADVYPAGRLDKDSEGLLLLTNDGKLQQKISDPRYKKFKTYLAQLEGEIDKDAIKRLTSGLKLKDGMTLPAKVKAIPEPDLWPRLPPVRYRKQIPTSWIEISIREGRNRQVRRMTAAVGYPTLRLVRTRVDQWDLGTLEPGQWQQLEVQASSA
ncbi:rluE [Symbiodinium microadriaticum]|nr:rluE [Symbiodinium microadriaticum]